MKKCVLAALCAVVVTMTSNSVFADYIIDEFDVPSFPNEQYLRVNSGGDGTTIHNGVTAAGTLGGTRDAQLTRVNAVGSVYVDANRQNAGFLTYIQSQTTASDDVQGSFAITWDGDSDGGGAATIDSNPGAAAGASPGPTLNVLSEDLTQGGVNNAIELGLLSNSVTVLSLILEIYDANGLASTFTLSNLAPSNADSMIILFSQFTDPSAFDDVHAMRLLVDLDNSVGGGTFQLGSIIAVNTIPEPSSMALFGIGAAGLAGWRLRRRKAATA